MDPFGYFSIWIRPGYSKCREYVLNLTIEIVSGKRVWKTKRKR